MFEKVVGLSGSDLAKPFYPPEPPPRKAECSAQCRSLDNVILFSSVEL